MSFTHLLQALAFAADKHRDQRRKGADASPYINHPIAVAELLASVGEVRDEKILMAALLHDTVEDTQTTAEELTAAFGEQVCAWVLAVTDDKTLPKAERKRLQIEHASQLCTSAQLIKLADKICNVQDVANHPPPDWSIARRIAYLDWSEQVVAGCREVNAALAQRFDAVLHRARTQME